MISKKVPTYFTVVRDMTNAPDMTIWWNNNIDATKQIEAANALKRWLSQHPNTIIGLACGNPISGTGHIKQSYFITGLKLSKDKRIELYDFFNTPIKTYKMYSYTSEVVVG